MSFDYTSLITDRTHADVARVKALVGHGVAGASGCVVIYWDKETT